MLPEMLAGSYQQYKADTNAFTTWLLKAEKKVKGKTREHAQAEASKRPANDGKWKDDAIKNTITTKDLLEKANAVAGRVEVPAGLISILKRVIKARQRCAEWFATTKVDNKYSNEGHQHFISVLEQILAILDQNKGTPQANNGVNAETSKPNVDNEASWEELTNRFQRLQVEELPDIEEPEPEKTSKAFVLEEDSEEVQLSLMTFYFFEDMHRIQDFLHNMWKGYKAGDVDLITASLVTNAAIDLVRENEKQIIASAPESLNVKRSYDTIAIVIFHKYASMGGKNPEEMLRTNAGLEPTPFDDFIYLSTARTLMKFDFLCRLPSERIHYPVTSFPFRSAFVTRPELLETPYMKKKEEEDILLSQLMSDLVLIDKVNKAARTRANGPVEHPPPVEDEISYSLRKLREKGAIHVWTVFAARIFLDLHDILGEDIKRGYQDQKKIDSDITTALVTTGSFVPIGELASTEASETSKGERITWLTNGSEVAARLMETSARIVNVPLLKKRYMEAIDKIQKDINGPLNHATIHKFVMPELGISEEHREEAEKLGASKPIELNRDPEFVFSHHPVYCGIVAFGMAIMNERAGLLLNNYHVVNTLIAHLYTEAHREGLLKEKWDIMDQMIAMHQDLMFAGKPPRSANEAWIRYSGVMGIATAPPGGRHTARYQRDFPYKEIQYQPLPLSEALYQFFDNKKMSLNSALGNVETLLQAEREKVYHASKHKRRNTRRKLTPLQFLEHLKEYIPTQLSDLRFDYIRHTRSCYSIMKKIRAELKTQLKLDYDDIMFVEPEESIRAIYPFIVQYILVDAKRVHESGRQRNEAVRRSPQMEIVAKVLKDYLDDQNRAITTR